MLKRNKKNAIIVFTREPIPGQTKTRLLSYYAPEKCAELHKSIMKDMAISLKGVDADLILCYTGGSKAELKRIFGNACCYFEQIGEDLGKRMHNAISRAHEMDYEKIILIGTDIPELSAETIKDAFSKLDRNDCVLGPTADGGYYLVGMKKPCEALFAVKEYGCETVFENTIENAKHLGLSVARADTYSDIDTKEDVWALCGRLRYQKKNSCRNTKRFLNDNAKISVIIPVYNEAKLIKGFADEIKQFEDKAEVIFVDGGSTDGTLEILEGSHRVIKCEKGRAKQMNAGAKASTGDILFFLHCDSVLPANCIGEIKRCMKGNVYGCFGVAFPSQNFFMFTNRIISNFRARYRAIPFGDQGIFIDRELFFKLGMYPEIPIMEDYAFSMKLKNLGYRPAWTRHRIITSARRYGNGSLAILKTEYMMWNQRRKYRKGKSVQMLAEKYADIR